MSETSAFSNDHQQDNGGNGAPAPGRRLLRRPSTCRYLTETSLPVLSRQSIASRSRRVTTLYRLLQPE
jgi:hypothetical protein